MDARIVEVAVGHEVEVEANGQVSAQADMRGAGCTAAELHIINACQHGRENTVHLLDGRCGPCARCLVLEAQRWGLGAAAPVHRGRYNVLAFVSSRRYPRARADWEAPFGRDVRELDDDVSEVERHVAAEAREIVAAVVRVLFNVEYEYSELGRRQVCERLA